MSDNSSSASLDKLGSVIIAYYALVLVIAGTVLNFLTFIILCRSPFRDTKKQPAMHYMRVIAIFDILMLYGWNLDHYLLTVHGFVLLKYSIGTCKFFGFLNYFTTQSSAWLRVFVCFDRYLAMSRLNRTWFGQPKSILIIIGCIIGFFALFNFHLILFSCYIQPNGEIDGNSALYQIYPLWDYIHLGLYNCGPFILMVIFNSGVIYHLIRLRRTTTIQNSRIQHRSISITLVITTFLFLIMTIPSSVGYAFFVNMSPNPAVLPTLDSILYTYHISSFLLYFITITDFRRACFAMITCSKNTNRIAATAVALTNARLGGTMPTY